MDPFIKTYSGFETDPDSGLVLVPKKILRNKGPIVDIQIHRPLKEEQELLKKGPLSPRHLEGPALIDTGAGTTSIDASVATLLKLPVTGTMNMNSATHLQVAKSTYSVRLFIKQSTNLKFNLDRVSSGDFTNGHGIIAIIGRDILELCQFIYDGPSGTITLALKG